MRRNCTLFFPSTLYFVTVLFLLHPSIRQRITNQISLTAYFPRLFEPSSSPFSPAVPRGAHDAVHARCVLYDRPPRTGSTTVARALTVCLRSLNYSVPDLGTWPTDTREVMLSRALDIQGAERVAAVSSHIALTAEGGGNVSSRALLQARCRQTLYVSGTARMAERILSQVKYGLVRRNVTVDTRAALAIVRQRGRDGRIGLSERFLEHYPYVGGSGESGFRSLGRREKEPGSLLPFAAKQGRILPDYVLSKAHMAKDLEKLLRALGCSVEFEDQNVHRLDLRGGKSSKRSTRPGLNITLSEATQDEYITDKIEKWLSTGDTLHNWLMGARQSRNEAALRYARSFS